MVPRAHSAWNATAPRTPLICSRLTKTVQCTLYSVPNGRQHVLLFLTVRAGQRNDRFQQRAGVGVASPQVRLNPPMSGAVIRRQWSFRAVHGVHPGGHWQVERGNPQGGQPPHCQLVPLCAPLLHPPPLLQC